MNEAAFYGIIFPVILLKKRMADNNKNRRGLQGNRGENQQDRTNVGNQQRTTQTGGQNNGGRNRNENQDMDIDSRRSGQNLRNSGDRR
jgi:hypothetical protein